MSRHGLKTGLILLALAGCSTDEMYRNHIDTGWLFYSHRKWQDATQQYMKALEEKPGDFDARIGLGNSSLEYGNDLYLQAHRLAESGNSKAALDRAEDATEMHNLSHGEFQKAAEEEPRRTEGWYGLGRLLYSRVANQLRFPYGAAVDEKAAQELERQKQRDLSAAIAAYEKVVELDPKSPHARRDLGLLYFSRLDTSRGDAERGREYLWSYCELLHARFEESKTHPVTEERAQKQVLRMQAELLASQREVLQTLRDYAAGMAVEEAEIRGKKEITAADRSRLESLTRERLITENYVRQLSTRLTGPEPEELPPPAPSAQ